MGRKCWQRQPAWRGICTVTVRRVWRVGVQLPQLLDHLKFRVQLICLGVVLQIP